MSTFTKSLVVAAAVAALYGAYSIGKNSNDSTQSKPLEEVVCEEIDTQGIYDEGRSDGYLAGLRHGINEGRITGKREGREDGFERGKQYGLEACDNIKFEEGLKACDDTKYQDGMIEGEQLGLREGKRRFWGSGTHIRNAGRGRLAVTTSRIVDGKIILYRAEGDSHENKSITIYNSQGIAEVSFSSSDNIVTLISVADLDNYDLENYVRGESNFPDYNSYYRNTDFYANQEIFLWADQKLQEETEIFSSPSYPINTLLD